jgi:hypothetical protein
MSRNLATLTLGARVKLPAHGYCLSRSSVRIMFLLLSQIQTIVKSMSAEPREPPPTPRVLSAPELLAADLPPNAAILDPILSPKTLALLYGPRGLGKTFAALGIAWAAASSAGAPRDRTASATSMVSGT